MQPRTVLGPYRHRESFRIPADSWPRRGRTLDAAAVERVASEMVRKAVGLLDESVDRLSAKLAEIEARADSIIERRRTMHDAAARTVRDGTMRDDALLANQFYGKDVRGRRPGEPGFGFDGEAMVRSGATLGEIHRAFWAKRA